MARYGKEMAAVFDATRIDMFWVKVEKTDSCWIWKAFKNENGYGVFWVPKKLYLAHRISYELTTAKLKAGECVLHHCDNPACVNPAHLFVGDQKLNSLDRIKKGRHKPDRTSMYFGVHRQYDSGRWRAAIRVNNTGYKSLGVYVTEIKAAAVYNFHVAMNKLDLPLNKIVL